jgi:hypothetical protein
MGVTERIDGTLLTVPAVVEEHSIRWRSPNLQTSKSGPVHSEHQPVTRSAEGHATQK